MSEQPLREPAFLVLTALAGGPLHGYALVEDVLRLSDGQVRLHTGTLYGVLDRLREAGLIDVDREEIVDSRLRRYYALTDAGIARLAAEAERMRRNANAAASRLRRLRPAEGAAGLRDHGARLLGGPWFPAGRAAARPAHAEPAAVGRPGAGTGYRRGRLLHRPAALRAATPPAGG